MALEIADTLLGAKNDFLTRASRFSEGVDQLKNCSGFRKDMAEEAAEIIKVEATRERHSWSRLGAGSGTFFAIVLAAATVFALSGALETALIASLLSFLAFLLLFSVGGLYDTQQNRYQIAESLLKSSAKRERGIEVSRQEEYTVLNKISSENRSMNTRSIFAVIVVIILAIGIGQIRERFTKEDSSRQETTQKKIAH